VVLLGAAVAVGPETRSSERGRPHTSDGDRAGGGPLLAASPTVFAPEADFSRLALSDDLPDFLPDVREFFFTRAIYTGTRGGWGRRGGSWATDYPKADHQFMVVVNRVTNLDGYDLHNAVRLDDPNLRRFPFLYALEVGYMRMTEAEVQGLRDYLEAGGFLVIDDFWGSWQWENFEREMARVLPGRPIVELPMDHPIFRAFYNIEEVLQVPGIGGGIRGRPTSQRDGFVPHVRGVLDDDGRLMVVVNFNTDLGDAWEHAENPYYPLRFSTYAYEMGVNMIVYGMSH
jgi:hypothetical protein